MAIRHSSNHINIDAYRYYRNGNHYPLHDRECVVYVPPSKPTGHIENKVLFQLIYPASLCETMNLIEIKLSVQANLRKEVRRCYRELDGRGFEGLVQLL